MRAAVFALLAGVVLAAGCADAARTDGPPPPVRVIADDVVLRLEPWGYCYGSTCVDGMPPVPLPVVDGADLVTVDSPLDDWTFTATFAPADVPCPRQQSVPVELDEDGARTLRPAGPAGTYDVTLFGQGSGDLIVSFRWVTPEDGPMPEPAARLALIAANDGRIDSYGVELELANLATTPVEASAAITVRADDGDELTFDAHRSPHCLAEGTAFWDGPDEDGLRAAALGPAPFTYEVEVVLDGSRHTATAVWPDDLIVGNEPSVALEFDPPLPALG